ncbi:MAG: Fic family protein [Lachnospiraceae bacterium]|nr:Fic family protein [Lachnospiraceae bacterium]
MQKCVEKGASKEKIGLRGPMPPGVLFAVYDSQTGKPDYIPPEYIDISGLLDELVEYVNTTDDHPLIVAAIVHYELVTIHPFEDGNGRTARLLSEYILDINGYGFNGIGSLEEYYAYDVSEYYEAIQMGLPALYYSGRNEPPHPEITPIEVSREFAVTNKTIINRLSILAKNGFVEPIMVKERIRSYRLSDFTKEHEKELKKLLQ